jgi:hypothetical protein
VVSGARSDLRVYGVLRAGGLQQYLGEWEYMDGNEARSERLKLIANTHRLEYSPQEGAIGQLAVCAL